MACNKIDYESKQDALDDAKLMRAGHNRHGKFAKSDAKKLRPYLCRYCGKWHLTSKKQWKKSRQRRGRKPMRHQGDPYYSNFIRLVVAMRQAQADFFESLSNEKLTDHQRQVIHTHMEGFEQQVDGWLTNHNEETANG